MAKVPITPAVLRWAIDGSGYSHSEIAAAIGVELQELISWETGKAQPTTTQLAEIAKRLKRPLAVFFLPRPPASVFPQIQFRHPPHEPRAKLNPSELAHIREGARLQRAVSWTAREIGHEPLNLSKLDRSADAEKAAAAARTLLGVSVNDQTSNWKNSSQAFKAWRRALEAVGVLVFTFPLGKASCRGFSLWDEWAPAIAVNTAWNVEARIFTLFHEYGHLITRTSSACLDTGGSLVSKQGDATERWCEHFAAAILMPWDSVTSVLRDLFGWQSGEVIEDLDQVRKLASQFRVSLRAAALRLIEHDVASWSLYGAIPAATDEKREGGGGKGRTRLQIRLDEYGNRAPEVLVAGVKKDVISRTDVLGYLDVSDTDLDALEGRFGGSQA